MKVANLLKLFEHYNSNSISLRDDHKRLPQINLPEKSIKRTVCFFNRKMVIPILLIMQIFNFEFANAKDELQDDACTVSIVASVVHVNNPGCMDGEIYFTPQTAEWYSWEIRPLFNLSIIASYGGLQAPGSIHLASFMAGSYRIFVVTESGCTGTTDVTINQPPCPAILPDINVTNSSVNGSFDGAISFSFTAGYPCLDNWFYSLISSSGTITDALGQPAPAPGILTATQTNLHPGNYTLKITNGGNMSYPSACFYSGNITVGEPPCDMNFTSSTIQPSANGCNNGKITLDITGESRAGVYLVKINFNGGTPAIYYAYETNGAGVFEIDNLAPGTYYVSVLNNDDPNSYECQHEEVIAIEDPACDISISNLLPTNLSGAGCNDGALDAVFTGITCNNSYTVSLSKDGNFFGDYYPSETAGAGTLNLTSMPAGSYSIEITNGSVGCIATQTFALTEPTCNTTIADFSFIEPTINVGNNGKVFFNAQGSNCGGSYYYELYKESVLQLTDYIPVTGSSGPETIWGLEAGTYELKLFSAYGSTCVTSQFFTLNNLPCYVAISSLTANNISSGCNNGSIYFNASGNTANGNYYVLIEKDGSYFSSFYATQTQTYSAVQIYDVPAGVYTITLSDDATTPCTVQQSISISETTCDVLILNPVLTEVSITGNHDGAVTGTVTGTTCSGNYLVKLFDNGNFITSQVVPVSSPVFEFQNLGAGLYQIQAFSGENVGNTCFNEYGFLLIDPCPVGNISVSLDTSLAPCGYVVVTAVVADATDPSTLYQFESRVDGGPWQPHPTFFGAPGGRTVVFNTGVDGSYEVRSGPLAVVDLCAATTGFNVYLNYCDAYTLSTTTEAASNNCSNGKFTLNIVDPQRCIFQTYIGYIFNGGDTVGVLNTSYIAGDNVTAEVNLPAGNYTYTFYTIGSYTAALSERRCPITGSFTIPNNGCNLSIINEVINTGCSGTDYTAQINGITCNGQYLVDLYMDGTWIQSFSIYESYGTGLIGFSYLQPGNYTVVAYADHLTPGTCIVESNFTVNPPSSCNLAITDLVITNAAADLSYLGSANFNVSGAECSGYTVTIMKDGFAYFSNNVTPSGSSTPVSFSSLPPDDYQIVFSNGICEVTQDFTITAGASTCTLNVSVTNHIDPNNGCSNGSLTINMSGNAYGNNYILNITKDGSNLLIADYSSAAPLAEVIQNLSAGNYVITLSYTGSGTCLSTVNYTLTNLPCDIPINNVSTTPVSCTAGTVSFNVTGAQCGTINQVVLYDGLNNNIGQQSWTSGAPINFGSLPAGNYSIEAITNYVDAGHYCGAIATFSIASSPCDIAINNVSTTPASCSAGTVSFNVTGTQCGTTNQVVLYDGLNNNIGQQSWTPGSTINFGPLPAGNYSIEAITNYVDAGHYCGAIATFSIASSLCNIAISNAVFTQACDEDDNGAIAFNLSGDICNNTSMQLLNNTGLVLSIVQINAAGDYNFNYLNVGSYSVQVTNASGCSFNYPFTISPICDINLYNETVSLVGAGSCTIGKLSYYVISTDCSVSFVRLTNNTTSTVVYQSNIPSIDGIVANTIENIPVGNYTLKVFNTSGTCSETYNFSIDPAPCSNLQFNNVTINPSQTNGCYYAFGYDLNLGNCPGSVLTLNQNGSTLETYYLTGSVSTEIYIASTGNYNLHLSSAGCEIDYPFEVVPAACNINIANSSVSSTGVSNCVQGKIDFDVTGTTCGTGAVALIQNGTILNTINWTTGNGTGLYFDNIAPGNYSIVAVNNLLNVTCGDTLSFTIDPVAPLYTISNITTSSIGVSSCTEGTVNFVVNGQICYAAGVEVYNESYDLVYSSTYTGGGNQSITVGALAPGNYIINFGESDFITESFSITPNPCNISINNVQVSYVSGSDSCTLAQVSFTPSGYMCSNGSVFLWLNGDFIDFHSWPMNTSPTFEFNNLAPGNYTIDGGSGLYGFCTGTYDFTVLPQTCTLNIAAITSTPSNGNNGTINVNGAGTYCGIVSIALDAEISSGNYSNLTTYTEVLSTQFTGLAPGNYRVTISSNGSTCSDVEYITVISAPCNTTPVITASSTSICPGQTIVLNSNYITGNVWSNGGTSFNTNITSAGTYTLTVTELNGCSASTSITISAGTNCVPATQMSNGVCGNMSYVKTSSISCLPVSGATQYEWQFSNSFGVYATKITTTSYILLHSVSPIINWGTNWNIKVRAKIGNNVGPYSSDCSIGIMLDPSIYGVPQTTLRIQDCNKQNYKINADNRLIANPVSGAIQYEFEFSDAISGAVVATKLQTNNVLFLNTVSPALSFPAQYNVRVRARIASTWGAFGTPCLIGIIGMNREDDTNNEAAALLDDIANDATSFDLMVMPNPFNEETTVLINTNINEVFDVKVYDVIGNIVFSQEIISNNKLNIGSSFAQGSYIMVATNQKNKRRTFRFVKTQ